MKNLAVVVAFALGAFAIAAGALYAIAVSEQVGAALLISVGLVALLAGIATLGTGGRDSSAALAVAQAVSLAPSGPSIWPMAFGLSVAMAAVGLAVGSGLVLIGLVGMTVASIGWFAQGWARHSAWTDSQSRLVVDRLIAPIALPLGMTALVAAVAIGFSRALLAASVNGSVAIALVGALLILGTGVFVADRNLGRSAVLSLIAVGALITAGLGVGGAVAGEREFHHPAEADHSESGGESGEASDGGSQASTDDDDAMSPIATDPESSTDDSSSDDGTRVQIKADDIAFDVEALGLRAGVESVIEFSNLEIVPHNVAISDESGETLFQGEILSGPGADIDYEIPPLEAGAYEFFCAIHPTQMRGPLTVG